MTILWIRLLADEEGVRWCTDSIESASAEYVDNLESMPWQRWSEQPNVDVRIIVPGEQVLSLPVTLPPGSVEDLQKALPYAIEDFVLEDEDKWHCVTAGQLPDGRFVAWVIGSDKLSSLLQRIPRRVSAVLPDYACLKSGEHVQHKNRRMVLVNSGLGAAMPLDLWPNWLRLMQAAEPALAVNLDDDAIDESTWFSPQRLREAVAGNLLQGAFAPKSLEQPWARWRWPLLASFIFLLCAALWFVGLGWYYRSVADDVALATQQRVKAMFPKLVVIKDLKRQVQQELSPLDLYQQQGVLVIHDRFVQALKRLPDGKLPQIQSLRFDTGKKRIHCYVVLDAIEHLDILLGALREQGMRPNVEGVNDSDGRSQVTLTVDW